MPKLPESFLYEFNLEPGAFSSGTEFEGALLVFFRGMGLRAEKQITPDGRRKMWVYKTSDVKLPKTPKGKKIKL